MYFDLMFQTSLTHLCYCNDHEGFRTFKNVQNEGARNISTTNYFIGFRKHVDVSTESLKDKECVRILNTKWVEEIIETTEGNEFEMFIESLKKETSINRKQRIPKACKEVIIKNADLVLKRQVTLIELKWDTVRNKMTYLACSSKTGKKRNLYLKNGCMKMLQLLNLDSTVNSWMLTIRRKNWKYLLVQCLVQWKDVQHCIQKVQ